MILRIPGRETRVPVHVGRALDPGDLGAALPPPSSGLLIADADLPEAARRHLEGLADALLGPGALAPLRLAAGEATKTAAALPGLWAELEARGLDRAARIVVAGGGSLLDVGAFLGATWLRGLETVLVPTTLLAQVDAGLGGKCGVNLGPAKNRVGLVVQPRALVVDTAFLDSLPPAERSSGRGEVVKTALLAGGDLLERVRAGDPPDEAIVRACLAAKAEIVARDEREGGLRRVLNLGHTLGHLFESLALARGRSLPHGVAVAMGLAAEARFWPSASARDDLRACLEAQGLQAVPPEGLGRDVAEVASLLSRDKKRTGARVHLPVLEDPGRPAVVTRPLEDLLARACAVLGLDGRLPPEPAAGS